MEKAREITLEELLQARELRAERQKKLVYIYKAGVISFMVNIPGKFKDTKISRMIHDEGRKILKKTLKQKSKHIVYEEVLYKPTGAEAFIIVDMNELKLKEILVEIEDNHSLGRLFDFDVIDKEYKNITRKTINQIGRKCLLCNNQAVICVRSQKHSYGELIDKINRLSKDYFNRLKYNS